MSLTCFVLNKIYLQSKLFLVRKDLIRIDKIMRSFAFWMFTLKYISVVQSAFALLGRASGFYVVFLVDYYADFLQDYVFCRLAEGQLHVLTCLCRCFKHKG